MGALIKLWLAVHPIRRWQAHRADKAAKRAAENQVTENVPVEAAPVAEGEGMSELAKSMGRSALKILGTALATWAATHGLIDVGAGDAFSAGLEMIVGGVAACIGLYLSHRTHAA